MCKNFQGGRENEIELLHVLWLTLDCDCCWGGQVSNGCFCTSSVSTYRYARQTWRPSMDFGTVVLPDAVSNLRPRGVKCRFREPSKGTVTELWLFSKKSQQAKNEREKATTKVFIYRQPSSLEDKISIQADNICANYERRSEKSFVDCSLDVKLTNSSNNLLWILILQDQAVRQRERRNQVRRRNPERRLTARRRAWSHCSSKDKLWQQKGRKGQITRQYPNDIFSEKENKNMRLKKKKFDIDYRKISSSHYWFLATKKSPMQSFFLFL